MKKLIAPTIALLVIAIWVLFSYAFYQLGYRDGNHAKGTWMKETKIDTVERWYFKPE